MKNQGCFECGTGQDGKTDLYLVTRPAKHPAWGGLACLAHLPAETIQQYPGWQARLDLAARRSEQARKNFHHQEVTSV